MEPESPELLAEIAAAEALEGTTTWEEMQAHIAAHHDWQKQERPGDYDTLGILKLMVAQEVPQHRLHPLEADDLEKLARYQVGDHEQIPDAPVWFVLDYFRHREEAQEAKYQQEIHRRFLARVQIQLQYRGPEAQAEMAGRIDRFLETPELRDKHWNTDYEVYEFFIRYLQEFIQDAEDVYAVAVHAELPQIREVLRDLKLLYYSRLPVPPGKTFREEDAWREQRRLQIWHRLGEILPLMWD
jgi:hypothetical protein